MFTHGIKCYLGQSSPESIPFTLLRVLLRVEPASLKNFLVVLIAYQKEKWEIFHQDKLPAFGWDNRISEVHLEVKGYNGDLMGIMGRGQMLVRWSEETKGVWYYSKCQSLNIKTMI